LGWKRFKKQFFIIFLIGSWFWFTAPGSPGAYFKEMKIIYTILFFTDTLLLILLSFILLRMIDERVNPIKLIFMLSAIILSIVTLIFFLRRYLKIPASDNHN